MMQKDRPQSGPAKILFVLHNLGLAGAQKVVVELVKGLDRARYTPVVCCLHKLGYYEPLLRQLGVELFVIQPSGLNDLHFVWRITRLIHQKSIRLVHVHQHLFDFWIAVSSLLAGVPCVVTKHNTYVHTGFEKLGVKAMERLTQRVATRYVTVSVGVRDYLIQNYGLKREALDVVYNGLDFAPYERNPVLREQARRKVKAETGQFLIGTVANLFPKKKGYEVLIEAVPAVVNAYPHVRFIWVGRDVDGLQKRLSQRAKELGVADHIKFMGTRNDVPVILGALDLFVLPSLREGLPYALLEAMAAGVPVIATKVGGIPEVIMEGETGLLVQPGDPQALALAIIDLIKNPEKARALAHAGRRDILSRFSAQRMVENYQEIYQACLSEVDRSQG